MFREIGRQMEGLNFREVDTNYVNLVLVDRPNVYMNMDQLIKTVNTVCINTLCEKYGYDKKAVDILLNSDSGYINELIKSKKMKVDKKGLLHYAATFKAACKHYKDHFDNINKDLYDNVINGFVLFMEEIQL